MIFYLSQYLCIDEGFSKNLQQDKRFVLYGTINETLTFTAERGTASPFFLYSDGRYNSSLTNYGNPFFGTNSSHVFVNISQYSESWSGEYSIVSYASCHSSYLFNQLQGCKYLFIVIDFVICEVTNYFILISVLELSVFTLGKDIMVS